MSPADRQRRALLRMFQTVTGHSGQGIHPPRIAGERDAVPFQRARTNNYWR